MLASNVYGLWPSIFLPSHWPPSYFTTLPTLFAGWWPHWQYPPGASPSSETGHRSQSTTSEYVTIIEALINRGYLTWHFDRPYFTISCVCLCRTVSRSSLVMESSRLGKKTQTESQYQVCIIAVCYMPLANNTHTHTYISVLDLVNAPIMCKQTWASL